MKQDTYILPGKAESILIKNLATHRGEYMTGIPNIYIPAITEAMKEYAKAKCEEQRTLLHEAINSRCRFDDESQQSNFVIEVMSEAKYPEFD